MIEKIEKWLRKKRDAHLVSDPLVWVHNYPSALFYHVIFLIALILLVYFSANNPSTTKGHYYGLLIFTTIIYAVAIKVFVSTTNNSKGYYFWNKGKFIEEEEQRIMNFNSLMILLPFILVMVNYAIVSNNKEIPSVKDYNQRLIQNFISGDFYFSNFNQDSISSYHKLIKDSVYTRLDTFKFHEYDSSFVTSTILKIPSQDSSQLANDFFEAIEKPVLFLLEKTDYEYWKSNNSYVLFIKNINEKAEKNTEPKLFHIYYLVNLTILFLGIVVSYLQSTDFFKEEGSGLFLWLFYIFITIFILLSFSYLYYKTTVINNAPIDYPSLILSNMQIFFNCCVIILDFLFTIYFIIFYFKYFPKIKLNLLGLGALPKETIENTPYYHD